MIPCSLCLLSLSSLTSFLVGQGDLTLLPTVLATLGGRQASILVAAAKVPGKALIGSDGSRPSPGTRLGPGRLWLARLGCGSPFSAQGWVSLSLPLGLRVKEGNGSLTRGRKGYWHPHKWRYS